MVAFEIIRERLTEALQSQAPFVAGISGPQGSGKSTLARRLGEHFGAACAVLGLDDFYLSKSEREALSRNISPLFETRGPPGTHDIALLTGVLERLLAPDTCFPLRIPRFDKVADDRLPEELWSAVERPPSLIVIEGWCVGAVVPPDFCAASPLNAAEDQDKSGAWRKYQAAQLTGPYAALWDRIDNFYHFDAPDFEAVFDWRLHQEASNLGIAPGDLKQSHRDWVSNFIQHYERLTRSMAEGYRRDGLVLHLARNRAVERLS